MEPNETTNLHRVPLREQIRDLLLQRIARGDLIPGRRIIEADLVKELQVSSSPVREALRELVAMGVLASSPHRGVWVREVSLAETMQAFEVRAVLEALAAKRAAPALQGRCEPLRQAVRRIIDAAGSRDFAAFQEHNQVFHRRIVEASDNAVLLRIWDSLAFQIRTRFTMDFLKSVDPVQIAREHEPVVEALDQGDADRAAELLGLHSRHLVEHLRGEAAKQRREEALT